MNFERGYIMGSIFFDILESGGIPEALNLLAEKWSSFGAGINIPTTVMLVLGAVIAVLVGSLGYKYIKLTATAVFAIAGFGIGKAFFEAAKEHWSLQLPDLVGTLVGVALLVLLGYLAYKKFAYALFGVACFAGFVVAFLIYPNYLLAVAAGVIVAMVSMYFVRYAFIAITSLGGGFVLIAMVSAIAPQISMLKLNEGFMGKLLAVVASLIFVAIQISLTGGVVRGKDPFKKSGPKRVKIRRVFDAW